jgi:ribosomal protein S18 acetylase RimI-like enzyme
MRRETLWFTFPPASNVLAAASVAVISHSLNAVALALRPFTVVRTRITYHARSDQIAALENWDAALGLAVVSDQASAIGVTAVPTPDTDRGSDLWFVFAEIMGTVGFVTGIGVAPEFSKNLGVDSKAMRKVEEGQDIVVVQEATAISAGVFTQVAGRMLIKLH